MLKYKINVLEKLVDAGYNTYRLRKENCFLKAQSSFYEMVKWLVLNHSNASADCLNCSQEI